MRLNRKRIYASFSLITLISSITTAIFTVGGIKYIKTDESEHGLIEKVFVKSSNRLLAFGNTGEDAFDIGGNFSFDAFGDIKKETLPEKDIDTSENIPPNQDADVIEFDINNPKLSMEMLNLSMSISKEEVKYKLEEILYRHEHSEYFNVFYLEAQNVIVIENKKYDSSRKDLKSEEVFGVGEGVPIFVVNPDKTNFRHISTEENGREVNMINISEGYNGHLEIIVDNYPFVLYNSPSIEPIGEIVQVPEKDKDDIDIAWEEYNKEDVIIPGEGIEWEDDAGFNEDDYSDFWNDYDSNETIEDVDTNSPTDTTEPNGGNEVDWDSELDELLGEMGNSSKDKNKYRPVWGTTEKSDNLKKNIKNKTYIEDKIHKKQNLNVINIKGEPVDLVEKTKNTAPSKYERLILKEVGEAEITKDHMPIVKASAGASFLLMILSLTSIQLYYKESYKEIQMKAITADTTEIEVSKVTNEDIDVTDIM